LRERVGILYQPKTLAAGELAQDLARAVGDLGVSVWVCSSWEESRATELAEGTELIVCLGGDGTILRAARIASPRSIPVLAVNLGRIGFMAEVPAKDALAAVPDFVKGEGWIEERSMLQAEVISRESPPYHALNDAVVARGERCRLIRVTATVNGEPLTTYKCDALVVSTATGSTGYSMAAGGPILHPLSSEMVLQPVAPHLSLRSGLVLTSESVVELEIGTTHQATLSIDGQVEVPLSDGDIVRVKTSHNTTSLLRGQGPTSFYGTLMQKLAVRE